MEIKTKCLSIMGRVVRRQEIKRTMKLFFCNVKLKKGHYKKHDLYIVCNGIRLKNSMMIEATYNVGLGNDLNKAIAISHFLHAYYSQWGVTIGEPLLDETGNYMFYFCGAYRKWRII